MMRWKVLERKRCLTNSCEEELSYTTSNSHRKAHDSAKIRTRNLQYTSNLIK